MGKYNEPPSQRMSFTIQAPGIIGNGADNAREMERDGMRYGSPGACRYATGRYDAAAPALNFRRATGVVGCNE